MTKKIKNANIEWLRIISMLMVVMVHALDKGNLLRNIFVGEGEFCGNINVVLAWVLESLAVVAVNVFFLISGYLLIDSEFKSKRIFSLIMEMVFYGGLIYFICNIFHLASREGGNYEFLQSFLPLHMDTYWFMTVYVFMYLLLPIVTVGIKALGQKQHLALIVLWLIVETLFKSIAPVKLEMDRSGYDLQWFIVLFLIAAYIKRYGLKFLNKPAKGLLMYFVGVTLVFIEQFVLDYLLATQVRFTYIQKISYSYNHIFVLIASVGLFSWGLTKKQPAKVMGVIATTLAPMSLGVYLMHEHVLVRYEWPEWLKVSSLIGKNPFIFVVSVLGVVLLVYVIGTIVDFIRICIFRLVDRGFGFTGVQKLFKRVDDRVNGRMD